MAGLFHTIMAVMLILASSEAYLKGLAVLQSVIKQSEAAWLTEYRSHGCGLHAAAFANLADAYDYLQKEKALPSLGRRYRVVRAQLAHYFAAFHPDFFPCERGDDDPYGFTLYQEVNDELPPGYPNWRYRLHQ